MMFKQTLSLSESLNYLQAIHQKVSHKINLSKKDTLLAIYIITGRVLTHCHSTSLLLQYGFIAEAGILIRSIYESVWVAEYLHFNADNSKILEEWYEDSVISPRKARKGTSAIVRLAGGNKQDEQESIEELNNLYNEFSKYTHPTFSISKINMHHKDFLYDYKCEEINIFYPELPFSFEEVIVLIINMFCFLRDIFDINQSEYSELRKYVDELQKD